MKENLPVTSTQISSVGKNLLRLNVYMYTYIFISKHFWDNEKIELNLVYLTN